MAPAIVIHDSDPAWPRDFEALRSRLESALGPLALRIDHIGSTSVPGLAAKDIIDIQVTAGSLAPEIVRQMTQAGFRYKEAVRTDHCPTGETEDPACWAKLFFTQGEGMRRANIHVRVEGSPNQRYALLFRDYLRAHPASAQALERIKRALAAQCAGDMDAYYDVKDPVCDLIWEAAKQWHATLSRP